MPVCIVVYCMSHDKIIIVQNTCHEWIHVCASINFRAGNESATFKGMQETFRWLASQQFKPVFVQVNKLLRFFFTVRHWDPLSSLDSLPALVKLPKQVFVVSYEL